MVPIYSQGTAQYLTQGWVEITGLPTTSTNVSDILQGLVGGVLNEIRSIVVESIGPTLEQLATTQANLRGLAHSNDCTVSGAQLWVGYGVTSPTTYWMFKSTHRYIVI